MVKCKHKITLKDCKVCLSQCIHRQMWVTCALCTGLVQATAERIVTRPKPKRAAKAPVKRDNAITVRNDASLLSELGIELSDTVPMKAPAPGFVRCQFCHVEIPEAKATEGRGQMRKTRIFHNNTPEVGSFDDEDLHYSSALVSCPECVLNIKPQMQGGKFVDGKRVGGSVLHSGIKFRGTEG